MFIMVTMQAKYYNYYLSSRLSDNHKELINTI